MTSHPRGRAGRVIPTRGVAEARAGARRGPA